jgi:hypothetical protein
MAKENNRSLGENSPNLVTLVMTKKNFQVIRATYSKRWVESTEKEIQVPV